MAELHEIHEKTTCNLLNYCQNVVPYRCGVRRENREKLLGQTSMVMWFTGLSGSGKSTIAHAVEERLHAMGRLTYVFDGDNVRRGLCRDLSFSPYYYEGDYEGGRAENLRRISAFISPLRADREKAGEMINCGSFFEMICYTPENGCCSTQQACCGCA